MSVNRFSPPSNTPTASSLTQVSQVFDDLNPIASFPVSSAPFLQVAEGAVQRCAPRALGMNVVIPPADGSNFNQTITLFMENALGSLRVRATSGTIDGAQSISLGAGITTCLILRSNGAGGWVSTRNAGQQLFVADQNVSTTGAFDVTLGDGIDRLVFTGASPTINSVSGGAEIGRLVLVYFNGTGVARFKHSTAGPSGNSSRMFNPDNNDGLLTPRGSFILQGNGSAGWRTLDWTANTSGNSSQITLTGIIGNQGTIDVSALACGGSIFVSAPTGDWQIEGFTGNNTPGFWFQVLVGNSAFIGTIFDEDGTASANDRIRCANAVDVVGTRLQALFHYVGTTSGQRWSCVSAPTIPAGRLLARTVYTTGTAAAHALNAATTRFIVKLQAGGSGGTGTAISTAANIAAGTPGAAGSYAERTFNVVAGVTSGTYTVGAAGTAGNNAGAASGAGGNTSFAYNAVVATALGGPASANVLANGLSLLTALGAAAPGVSTNCDLATTAPGGDPTVRLSGTVCWTGKAGSSSFGNGGDPRSTAGAGVAATGFGCGGGAGLSINASAAVTGGAGTGGFIIVEEYS